MCPRPRKHRTCCCPFLAEGETVYKPAAIPLRDLERVDLGRDELEALLLCDREGLTQAQAGLRMGVSRGTVQRLVTAGRQKVAEALGAGKALVVGSGPEAGEGEGPGGSTG